MKPSLRYAALVALSLALGCAKGSSGADGGSDNPGSGGATATSSATTGPGSSTTASSGGSPATGTTTTSATTSSAAAAGGGGASGAGTGGLGGAPVTSSTTTSASSSSASSSSASTASGAGGALCGVDHVLISEIRTRGLAGGNDEFVELFNPTGSDVTLDSTWTLDARASDGSSYSSRWVGNGATIPAHHHFLVAGASYVGPPAADSALSTGIKDASSVVLHHGTSVEDAVCFVWSAAQTYGTGFTCEGPPADNAPHDDSSSSTSDVDASLARKMAGCQDTDSSVADFQKVTPSHPENSAQ